MNMLIHWLVSAVAVAISAYILPGIAVAGFGSAMIVALVLGIINAVLGPILAFLTLPINILTLGLFTFVVNALLVMLAGKIVPGFKVDGFWPALLFALVLSIISGLLGSFIS